MKKKLLAVFVAFVMSMMLFGAVNVPGATYVDVDVCCVGCVYVVERECHDDRMAVMFMCCNNPMIRSFVESWRVGRCGTGSALMWDCVACGASSWEYIGTEWNHSPEENWCSMHNQFCFFCAAGCGHL